MTLLYLAARLVLGSVHYRSNQEYIAAGKGNWFDGF